MGKMRKEINILGTKYLLSTSDRGKDPFLNECDGYCDKTSKKIVVSEKSDDNELECFEAYQRKVMRHEIIHAFLFESGLHENFTHDAGHDETYVDWIAVQFPKMQKVFEEVGCLE